MSYRSPRRAHAVVTRLSQLRRSLGSAAANATKPDIYDIVCIGGGPAGLSLLTALRSHASTQDLKIALVDGQNISASSLASTPDIFSNRCSSLTPSSIKFLQRIGVWQHIDSARAQPYHGMHVWDGVSGTKISFDQQDRPSGLLRNILRAIPGTHNPALDYEQHGDADVVATMCENNNLTTALMARLKQLEGIEILDNTKVSAIDFGPEQSDDKSMNLSQWPTITLSSNRTLAARLLIGADGANSPVRKFADIPAHGWDYNAHGVVATLSLDQDLAPGLSRTAFQRFLPTGPIALLPLPGKKASLVWSTTPQVAAKLKSLSPDNFTAMVNAAFRLLWTDIAFIQAQQAGQVDELAWREDRTDSTALGLPAGMPRVTGVQSGSIASFPLRLRHADTYTGHRVALIGDAAHTIHPLAGQGLNLGLADAEALTRRITEGVETGMDIGTNWCLDGYNSDRWAANNAVMGVCDKLNKLYSTDSAPVVAVRSLGLGLVDKLGPLKGLIMGAASGSAA